MDAALLIIALLLVLAALAPVAPASGSRRPTALRVRITRQLHLWDRYLATLYGHEHGQGR